MNSDDSFDSSDYSDSDHSDMMSTSSVCEKPSVPWSDLPCIALENIYSHLSRKDQRCMSMTCRNWRKEYGSPSLWRNFRFLIPESDLNLEVYPEVQFARKYGCMFRHVEIVCRRVRYRLTELISKQLKLFLQALTFHSQLRSVKFLDMVKYFSRLDNTLFDEIYQSMTDFFSSQHQLRKVEFQNAQFQKLEAAEVLRTIFLKNSRTLQDIRLNGFVEENPYDDITEGVVDGAIIFESLLNIKSIQLDYSQIFESIMMKFYEYAQNLDTWRMKGNMELIEIFCDGSRRSTYQGIPPECWKFFAEIFPTLRIKLTYYIESQIRNSVNFFVVRGMPLKTLHFKWEHCRAHSETEIGVLFRHLNSCGTNEYLEDLSVVWLQNRNNLARDLTRFLQTCKKLRLLQLYLTHPVGSLDTVFSSWLENRPPSLRDVHITVGKVHRVEDATVYSNMAEMFWPLLQTQGLNLHLIVDSDIRSLRNR